MAMNATDPNPAGWLRRAAGRRARRGLWAALAVLGLLAGLDGWQWWRAQRWNAQILALTAAPVVPAAPASAAAAASAPSRPGDAADAAEVPELQFAQALALAAQGQEDAALNRYGLLGQPAGAGGVLAQAARFNSANLLLRQAQRLQSGAQPGQALALIELAKEGYREVLRRDPEHWPARYNLERAQRLLPDPEEGDDPPPAGRQAERAATTMRGYSPGLP